MDIAWATEKLEQYLHLCGELDLHQERAGYDWDDVCSRLNKQAELLLPTVEKIVRVSYPKAPHPLMPPGYTSTNSQQWVRRALGALRDTAETEVHLRPSAPSLFADSLHGRIWAAAAPVWDTGEFGAALQQASITLSAYIRAKASSTLRDRKLVAQVFSPDPPKLDAARLHFPGDSTDEGWQARQQGLHLIAQGAFAGIRNIAAHEDVDVSEHEALEQLAVLSLIARWTDMTELRTRI
ncbi:TIGR02391 family protein [Rudaeicoccus suwonensis]|nr:TIGR02391 family protein [Rudaeicoccus suwonensis]